MTSFGGMPSRCFATTLLVLGSSLAATLLSRWMKRRKMGDCESELPPTAHEQLIEAGTPLVKLLRLSKLIRRSVFVKMESLNPGGTGKDRAALSMIRAAESSGFLPKPKRSLADDELFLHPSLPTTHTRDATTSCTTGNDIEAQLEHMVLEAIEKSRTGGLVVEGTSGSTGIALATLCASRGHACLVVLPDDQAEEKQKILRSLGAMVLEVPTASISNPKHYVNLARTAARLARERFDISAVFVDQFENEANFNVHFEQTGPEIWNQMDGQVDAFVMSSGTGGTISGVSAFLKQVEPDVEVVLVDPPGSSLYHKVEHGVAYAPEQQERTIRKHRYDTLAEGIGLDRVTQNFQIGYDFIDRAIRVTDQEAVDMAHWILQTEGLWMGSSSAMNIVGAIRTALALPEGSQVVTVVCDGGQRHATRFWDPKFVQGWGLRWPDAGNIPACLQPVVCG